MTHKRLHAKNPIIRLEQAIHVSIQLQKQYAIVHASQTPYNLNASSFQQPYPGAQTNQISKYQPYEQYKNSFNEPFYQNQTQSLTYFHPYEYQEAVRETAEKMRKQEQMRQNCKSQLYKPPLKPYKPDYIDVEEFASIFREMVMYEVKCEALRIQLALQPDFRVPVLWSIFDRSPVERGKLRNESLSWEDFQKGCRAFSVDPDPVDIKLLMSKYKNVGNQNGEKSYTNFDNISIDYQEFFAIFYPLSKGDLFDVKLNTQDTDSDRFFFRTNMLVERLIRMMLSQEDAFEYYRREIQRKGINLKVVYDKINQARDSQVNVDELRLFLVDYGLAVTKEDLQLFLMRFDKTNKGYFGRESFEREFTPKLGLKK
ncbi:hypothetical protein PPERSA_01735 [Pseudocohnilembus persalinus]|uniref:EF-hand domain-containing protein n=1 Tax=Pseudocohnilembus persalinus TaxID=266149 RepID=A0A0V0R153_PSEPJ|nr:hypothetical protein PPERSA_01735 [Pseudocohnilembus persalinus]|eukprot:KRX08274.1 hypothetical protein PPERSA_01735 [Pseudocohnilembus persalinus]